MFRAVVASAPPQLFKPSDSFLIEAYASALVLCRKASDALARGPEDSRHWLKTFDAATKAAQALAVKLRVAPSSRGVNSRQIGRYFNGDKGNAGLSAFLDRMEE